MNSNEGLMPRPNTPPPIPTFSVAGSIASILSLMLMSALSVIMLLHLRNPEHNLLAQLQSQLGDGGLGYLLNYLRPPNATTALAAWTWIPFAFTIFGSTLGWLFELGLLLAGTPFQQTKSPFTRLIQKFRFLNLAPVTTSIFFFVCTMMIPDADLRFLMMCISGAACAGLGFALFFGGDIRVVPMVLLGSQVLQVIIVLVAGIPVGGAFLLAQAVLQFAALQIGTFTPTKSTIFHILSTVSGVMLYGAILQATGINSDYSHQVATLLPAGSLAKWLFIAACVAGLFVVIKALPLVYGHFRTILSSVIWTPLHFLLVSGKRFDDPFSLHQIYKDHQPKTLPLKPYYQAHPAFLFQKLDIPAVEVANLPRTITIFAKVLKQVVRTFKLIEGLDHSVPQANSKVPIKNKQRMMPGSSGSEYWPKLFSKTLFGLSLPETGKFLQKTPNPLLAAFHEGQVLAYLAESGVANPLLQPAAAGKKGALMLDFRFLEKYTTKENYESYGGIAYFQINEKKQKLELTTVVAPHTTAEVAANPGDPTFRHIESLLSASLYYQIISGKHLAEIHMTHNLVEVSMNNAFDAQGQWNHPFRVFLHLHFFSHLLAEEITTEHLVQEGAVFSQVFATTHDSLIQHLTDCYTNFEYGKDEDFAARKAMMTMENGDMLPKTCVGWESQYFDIWLDYSTALIEIIYPDDQAVKDDKYLQDFHTCLLDVMLKGLPQRYDGFQSRKGVARFAADTIHHTVIRHQVYGTTGVKAALDPRIGKVQVPRDTGTYAVNEWRALAYVALATAHSRFTLLTGKNGKDFTYLLEGVKKPIQQDMAKVFKKLQDDLLALDAQWTKDETEKTFNYDYFRPIPSDLHTGPGY